MKVYLAQYNSCTWESAYGTISIHETHNGAEEAIAKHMVQVTKEWREINQDIPDFVQWRIEESEVLK